MFNINGKTVPTSQEFIHDFNTVEASQYCRIKNKDADSGTKAAAAIVFAIMWPSSYPLSTL
jgi:hypothetical protein